MVWISTGRFNMIMGWLLVGFTASLGIAGVAAAVEVVGLVFEAVLAEAILAVLVEAVVLVAVEPVAAFDWAGLDQPAQN